MINHESQIVELKQENKKLKKELESILHDLRITENSLLRLQRENEALRLMFEQLLVEAEKGIKDGTKLTPLGAVKALLKQLKAQEKELEQLK